MKKKLSLLAMLIFLIIGTAVFAACTTTPPTTEEPPQAPALEKSSFNIEVSFDGVGGVDYSLNWQSDLATSYEVVYGESRTTVTEPTYSLNGFAADEVHTVTVTALGEKDTHSDPVEVKFKGAKLSTPINVRLYGDTNSFGWKGCEETFTYLISCEELDLDINTSRPIGTGKIKSILAYSDRLYINDLREIYNRLDLYALERFRVQSFPYNGNLQRFIYTDETDVIEFQLPSDVSEQSVNFYAGEMSNPTNLRWDMESFENDRNHAYIKWDGASSGYTYLIKSRSSNGNYSGIRTEKGASQGKIFLDNGLGTDDFTVTVEAECTDFNYIGESQAEKWVTYSFFYAKPATEELHFHSNRIDLETPKNVRVEGENIVWDEVAHTEEYHVTIARGEERFGFYSEAASLPLQEIFSEAGLSNGKLEGDFNISVTAFAVDPELVSFENNFPVFNSYRYSEESQPLEGALTLKAIPALKNVTVDWENYTLSWEDIPEATCYYVGFYRQNGNGVISTQGKTTQFSWNGEEINYKDSDYILIMADCNFEVTNENGTTALTVPKFYRIEIPIN